MENFTIDLGSVNQAPAGAGNPGPITGGNAWRALLRGSEHYLGRRQDPRLALNHLRPNLDSTNPQIRANATLRKEEWKVYDDAVVQANQETLFAVRDVLDRGLRYDIGDPFGTTVIERDQLGEMSEAQVSMYAGTPPESDRVTYTLVGVPVPVISKGFWLDERVLSASRRRGQTLDAANAAAATRVVNERLEQLLFTGGVVYGGYTLHGYTNHPNVNTGSLTGSWLTLSTTFPKAIINDVIAMKQTCTNDHAMGPYMLYVPHAWIDALDSDYFAQVPGTSPAAASGATSPTQTIRQRILQVDGIAGVRPTTQLTATVLLVSMTSQTIRVGFGFEPRLIQWETQGGMVNHFRVLSIMTFIVDADYAGRSGIAYFS